MFLTKVHYRKVKNGIIQQNPSKCTFSKLIYRAFHNVVRDYTHNKKTKGPTLMELFTATGKLEKFFFTTRDVLRVHHG